MLALVFVVVLQACQQQQDQTRLAQLLLLQARQQVLCLLCMPALPTGTE